MEHNHFGIITNSNALTLLQPLEDIAIEITRFNQINLTLICDGKGETTIQTRIELSALDRLLHLNGAQLDSRTVIPDVDAVVLVGKQD